MVADSKSLVTVPSLHDRTDQPRETGEASVLAALMATALHKPQSPGQGPWPLSDKIADDPRPCVDVINPARGRDDDP